MKQVAARASVEAYIEGFPAAVQAILRRVRKAIKQAVPAAAESISYGMPAYKVAGKPLVYFAGYARHIGFYATPTGHAAFKQQLAAYKQGRGSVQFPLDAPMPYALIGQIAAFRANALAPKPRAASTAPAAKRMAPRAAAAAGSVGKRAAKPIAKRAAKRVANPARPTSR